MEEETIAQPQHNHRPPPHRPSLGRPGLHSHYATQRPRKCLCFGPHFLPHDVLAESLMTKAFLPTSFIATVWTPRLCVLGYPEGSGPFLAPPAHDPGLQDPVPAAG